MKFILRGLCFALFALQASICLAEDLFSTRVERIVDGDTLLTIDGDFVRLLDINTPEIHHDGTPSEPFAETAKKALAQLLPPQTEILLQFGDSRKDRYKRLLAHIYTAEGNNWVNGYMVKEGFAHVYSFPDNAFKAEELIPLETTARKAKKGIWSLPRWQVLDASQTIPDDKIGQFSIVQGRVLHTAEVKGIIYLNFGEDWRTDFSVEIPHKYLKKFTDKNIDPASYYKRKKLNVRGRLKPVNGILVTVTHPEQLTILSEQIQ